VENGIKPPTIMMIGGGVVLFIASFLDWQGEGDFGVNGWETDFYGLQGIFVAIIGAIVAIGVALTTFGNASLPDSVLGLRRNQVYLVLGVAAFLITFGLQFAQSTQFGIILGWIGAAVMTAGAFMEEQAPRSASPPTQF
jgi:hypothetical protein